MADGLDKDVIARLRMTPLFAGLGAADIGALAAGARLATLPDQHPLYEAGAPLENLHVILDGRGGADDPLNLAALLAVLP